MLGRRQLPLLLTVMAAARAFLCEPGFGYDAATSSCVECRAGSWNDGSQEACQRPSQCTFGQGPKAGAINATDCMDCPAGYYSDNDDATPCKIIQCTPGFFSAAVNAKDASSTCVACAPSTFSKGLNDLCHQCGPGTYAGLGQGACLPTQCPPNAAPKSNATTATDCDACGPGHFSPGGDAPCVAMRCASGSEPNAEPRAVDDCEPCSGGTYSAGGINVCANTSCPRGTFAPPGAYDAVKSCKSCAPGCALAHLSLD
ncbi:hypothetical protein ACHHYP_20258 [Achlya hypogyna]|uniref:Zona-pellucida-binding protein 1/2 C-terminal domain-containing protein n=1 Tax=Achlya hypogyna TaxID=1202772 RepID=A0A1V9YUJ1_ACHHY|nr:hypothetical protein ACHHYP_20258 [Achlya hypogyna]